MYKRITKRKRTSNGSGYSKRQRRTGSNFSQSAGFQQYAKKCIKHGRRMKNSQLIHKLENQGMCTVTDRAQNVNTLNSDAGGAIMLDYKQDGNDYAMPCVVFSLDAHPALNRLSGNSRIAARLWRKSESDVNNPNGLYWRASVAVEDPITGFNQPGYTVIRRKGGNILNGVEAGLGLPQDLAFQESMRLAVLKSIRLDFIFRGATARPTFFKIQVVQMHQDYQEALRLTMGNSSDHDLATEESQFWQRQLQRYLYSPLIAPPNPIGKRKMFKVIKQTSFMIQPDSSVNNDTVGLQKRVCMDININRMRNFSAASSNDRDATNISEGLIDEQLSSNTSISMFETTPERRLYVIIRATHYDGSGVLSSPATSGSIDWSITRNWIYDASA